MSRHAADTLRRSWRADLTRAGLRLLPGPGFAVSHVVRRARVEARAEFTPGPRFVITATHPGVPQDLAVRLEGERGLLRRTFGPGDVRTWDEAFDALAEVRGDTAWVLAAFNPGTRKRLTDALNAGLVVQAGRLEGALVCERAAVLIAWLGFAVDLITRLSLHADRVAPSLLRRAEAEADPRAQAALLDALGARLAAAGSAPPWPLVRRLLVGEARDLGLGIARRWIEADAAQAEALGEAELLATLPGAGPVARAAIAARLGAIGTARCLPALRGLAEAFFERGAVKAAAREAQAAVLARTPTAVGALAVIEAEAALSFADEEEAP